MRVEKKDGTAEVVRVEKPPVFTITLTEEEVLRLKKWKGKLQSGAGYRDPVMSKDLDRNATANILTFISELLHHAGKEYSWHINGDTYEYTKAGE